jgi:anti-repressor protein
MNELIKVTYDNNRQTTSARDLWDFLDKPYEKFTKWFDQYRQYGFEENHDYRELCIKVHTSNGAEHDAIDYEITVDMAKELAMLQKSEKGKIARQYFLELEKKWNSPELVMARALKMADNTITHLQGKIKKDEPKVAFADSVAVSTTTILIGDMAKILCQNGLMIGQNRLFERLRKEGYLISKKGTSYNMPTQKSMELGLFKIKETVISRSSGETTILKTPKVTGKGQIYFVSHFLGSGQQQRQIGG